MGKFGMSIDKSKVWAKARVTTPLIVKYCSDTTRYHSMTIARGMIVQVGEMPPEMGKEKQWCVFYQRGKGYFVLDFISTEKAKKHLQTILENGEIKFDSISDQKIISHRVIDILTNGVEVEKKILNKVSIDPKIISAIKKELF